MPSTPRQLYLTGRLAFLEVRATGFDPRSDRIVEVAVHKIGAYLQPRGYRSLVNPGIPILAAATAAHGLADADVAPARPFAEIAPALQRFLGRSNLAGFDIHRFALPLLDAEFDRAGVAHRCGLRAVIDVGAIYRRYQPRDFRAAARDYLGAGATVGRDALTAAEATAAILGAQVARHEDLPDAPPDLQIRLDPHGYGGWLVREGGRTFLASGWYRGRPLIDVALEDPAHLRTILTRRPPRHARWEIEWTLKEAANLTRRERRRRRESRSDED